jgi:MYND finger
MAVEKGLVWCDSELSMIRFLHFMAPCKCLKPLKSKLKKIYGPQTGSCGHCQAVGDIGEFYRCSGCQRRYCSEACQQLAWEQNRHGGFCNHKSAKKASKRLDKLAELVPDMPYGLLESMDEEAKKKVFDALDRMSLEEVKLAKQEIQNALEENSEQRVISPVAF